MQHALGWSAEYDALDDPSAFATQQSSVTVNGMRVTALAHTPIRTRVDSDEFSFFMPVDGGAIESVVNGERVRCDPMRTALLAPEGERIGTGRSRSIVVAVLEKPRLLSTARAMLRDDEAGLDLQRPSILPLAAGPMNFDLLLRSACRAFDACSMNPVAAAALAVDDTLYRTICAMLLRERLFAEAMPSVTRSGIDAGLDLACEYILANLGGRISMTDLERISGLSTRTLQYAFQKRFGCTPVTWIRNERLTAARALLLAADEKTTVTDAALAFGFSNLGNFSRYYSDKFGEYPSQTLADARARM
ncbi:helix-turn-helix domain-containing protein [Xanthobacter sediminis]|uniref:helix-turn-helix domain-containing protein n=1 Tax=Xanthobacter sediminis TaxID=3119926 RepID=UPI00372A80B3